MFDPSWRDLFQVGKLVGKLVGKQVGYIDVTQCWSEIIIMWSNFVIFIMKFKHEIELFGKIPNWSTRDSKTFLWYSWWSLFSEKSSMKNHFRLKRMNKDKNGGHFLDYRIWKGPLMESWNYITRFISTYHLQMRMASCRSRE